MYIIYLSTNVSTNVHPVHFYVPEPSHVTQNPIPNQNPTPITWPILPGLTNQKWPCNLRQ